MCVCVSMCVCFLFKVKEHVVNRDKVRVNEQIFGINVVSDILLYSSCVFVYYCFDSVCMS